MTCAGDEDATGGTAAAGVLIIFLILLKVHLPCQQTGQQKVAGLAEVLNLALERMDLLGHRDRSIAELLQERCGRDQQVGFFEG